MTNVETFERIYTANIGRVRGFLRAYLGSSPVVDDVAQETFVQFWRRPNSFDPARSTVRTYLLGIARKRAADWWRRQRPTSETPPELASASNAATFLLSDAIDHLAPDLRNVLWLREVEGYSYDELAHILDVPIGTVRSRLFAAREQLRQLWHKPPQPAE